MKPTVKIRFSKIAGDDYESTVDVTIDGNVAGYLFRDNGDYGDGPPVWMPSESLAREMESLHDAEWRALNDAKRACRAAATNPDNRCMRLAEQRRAMRRAAAADSVTVAADAAAPVAALANAGDTTPATPTCAALSNAAPLAIVWHGNRAYRGDELVAVTAQTYGGLRMGLYDASGDAARDGMPRLRWHVAGDIDLDELNAAGRLDAIPDDAELNP